MDTVPTVPTGFVVVCQAGVRSVASYEGPLVWTEVEAAEKEAAEKEAENEGEEKAEAAKVEAEAEVKGEAEVEVKGEAHVWLGSVTAARSAVQKSIRLCKREEERDVEIP